MEDLILDLGFFMIAILSIMFRLIFPILFIVIGILEKKKNNKDGRIILIIGIAYLSISIANFVHSAIVYGF